MNYLYHMLISQEMAFKNSAVDFSRMVTLCQDACVPVYDSISQRHTSWSVFIFIYLEIIY